MLSRINWQTPIKSGTARPATRLPAPVNRKPARCQRTTVSGCTLTSYSPPQDRTKQLPQSSVASRRRQAADSSSSVILACSIATLFRCCRRGIAFLARRRTPSHFAAFSHPTNPGPRTRVGHTSIYADQTKRDAHGRRDPLASMKRDRLCGRPNMPCWWQELGGRGEIGRVEIVGRGHLSALLVQSSWTGVPIRLYQER